MRIFRIALHRKPVLIITAATACLGLIVYLSLRAQSDPPMAPSAQTVSAQQSVQGTRKTVNAGLPVRLKIPKIGVDATLEHVGLTVGGDLDAPKNPANAAWYTPGPRPGDSGNAIIDGHFGYKNRVPAVFDDLHKLEPGDSLYVEDEQGTTVAFVVRELRTYSPGADTAAVFRPNDGQAHLNLITCKGAWNKDRESYSARLVVFTDKAIEQ
jgi:LPXTG-site transpeptidase (sortase) family protein